MAYCLLASTRGSFLPRFFFATTEDGDEEDFLFFPCEKGGVALWPRIKIGCSGFGVVASLLATVVAEVAEAVGLFGP